MLERTSSYRRCPPPALLDEVELVDVDAVVVVVVPVLAEALLLPDDPVVAVPVPAAA